MGINWAGMTTDERVNLLRSTGKFRSVGECRRLASAGPEVLKRVVEREHFFSDELKDYLETWNTVLTKGADLVHLSDTYKQKILDTLSEDRSDEEKKASVQESYDVMSEINSAVFGLRQAHLIGMILSMKEKSIQLLTKLDEEDYETKGEIKNDIHDSTGTTQESKSD